MKVIFLDFDGPMVPFRASVLGWIDNRTERFDPVAVETVKRLADESGASIIISSSWRTCGYDRMVKILELNNIKKEYLHEDWATKDLVKHSMVDRPIEINEWLSRHPEVDDYIIIDDAKMKINNLIHVSSFDGITYKNQLEMFKHFNVSIF